MGSRSQRLAGGIAAHIGTGDFFPSIESWRDVRSLGHRWNNQWRFLSGCILFGLCVAGDSIRLANLVHRELIGLLWNRAALENIIIPFAPLIVAVTLTILLGLLLMPKSETMQSNDIEPGRWDILSRILIGTAFIILLTEMAPLLGSRLTGLLATIPLYTAILTVFSHRLQGPAGAAHVLRGLLFGLFGFAGFFLALSLLIERSGITIGFLVAIAAALVIQGLTFLVLQMEHRRKDRVA